MNEQQPNAREYQCFRPINNTFTKGKCYNFSYSPNESYFCSNTDKGDYYYLSERVLNEHFLLSEEEKESFIYNPNKITITAEKIDLEGTTTKPQHYHRGDIDVIEFMERHFGDKKLSPAEGFFIGNIIKYVCRYDDKNGLDDLEKAKVYLNRLVQLQK